MTVRNFFTPDSKQDIPALSAGIFQDQRITGKKERDGQRTKMFEDKTELFNR